MILSFLVQFTQHIKFLVRPEDWIQKHSKLIGFMVSVWVLSPFVLLAIWRCIAVFPFVCLFFFSISLYNVMRIHFFAALCVTFVSFIHLVIIWAIGCSYSYPFMWLHTFCFPAEDNGVENDLAQVFVRFSYPRWPIILYVECLVFFHVSFFPHKRFICTLYIICHLFLYRYRGLTDGLQFKSPTAKRYQFMESMYIQYTPTSMQNFTKWMLNHAYRRCHMLLTMQPIIYCRLILVPHSVGTCTLPCFVVLKGKRLKSMRVCSANEGKERGGERKKNPVNGDIAWGCWDNWVNEIKIYIYLDGCKRHWMEHLRRK